MRKSLHIGGLLTLGVLTSLAACSGDDLTRSFGLVRDAPDEFTVSTRAPLSMPPDYSLRKPRPGASRPQEQTSRSAAEAALSPQAALAGNAPTTPGQLALLDAAGPPAPGDIRAKVDQDSSLETADRGFVDRLMFWRGTRTAASTQAVDPQREAQRLRENAALGQAPQQGDTPIIQRRTSRGILDWF